jgi:Domain of unknown function (DUF4145)
MTQFGGAPVYEAIRLELPQLDDVFGGDPPDSVNSLVVDAAAIDEFFNDDWKDPAPEQKTDKNSNDSQVESRSPWQELYEAAYGTAADIEFFVDLMEPFVEDFKHDREQRKWRFDARNGIAAWRSLINETGFDLAGVFRRRQLVPFVMIPRHVSARHGAAEPLSLLTLLRQAQEAFVYGVPFAAVALMRATLELLLKEHYPSAGNDLEQLINSAARLPKSVTPARLHQIRQLGNDVLHFRKTYFSKERTNDLQKFEQEIVSHFLTLQILIEQTPPSPIRR